MAVAEPEQRAIFIPQICTVFVQSLCINTLPAAMSRGGEPALLFPTVHMEILHQNAAFVLNAALSDHTNTNRLRHHWIRQSRQPAELQKDNTYTSFMKY